MFTEGGELGRRTRRSKRCRRLILMLRHRSAALSNLAYPSSPRGHLSLLPAWIHQEIKSEINQRRREEENIGHEEEPVLIVAAREAGAIAVDRTAWIPPSRRLESARRTAPRRLESAQRLAASRCPMHAAWSPRRASPRHARRR